MTPRLYLPLSPSSGAEVDLPAAAARHALVRRVQPGDALMLFDGSGCDWPAQVLAVGRSAVRVRVGVAQSVDRELAQVVTLALVMPANERMDMLVEKATELGVAAVQPLLGARSVLRPDAARAARKRAHWRSVAQSACEQCGRAIVPRIEPMRALLDWLPEASGDARLLLSLQPDARPLAQAAGASAPALTTLSGPEGGLTPEEEAAARRHGFVAVALGPRVLRADTAPLAALAWLGLQHARPGSG